MDTRAKKEYNERIGHTTRNKRKDESKEKKNGQGFNKINRICSLSRLLNESYSTLITSKIEEYRKNDALLAEKSDSDIIQHYIRKLVEYRSKMAYFAGVRGKMFFAFLHEELEHATNDSDRDQIWSNILNKNDKSILTTIFNQLCNPRCEKSRFKLMQQVIDVSNNIELLTALDIQEITYSDSLFSSLASIMAPRAIQKSLAIELKTSFCNNLSEELFSTLRKRIAFLVGDILSDHSKDTKKMKSTYIDQIYRKTIGLEYNETDGITNSIDAEEFVEKSRDCLGLPHLHDYQHIMEEEKWKFIVNEKWIAFNHRYAISYLLSLLQWTIQEEKKDTSIQIQCQRSMRRPQIFPQFRADSDFTVLNLETWYYIAKKFGVTFSNDDGGGWNQTRFRRAITRLQPWSIPNKPIYEFAEHDFSLAYGVLSEFIDLDFVYKVFIKKPGFRGMKFDYTIVTNGESCHLNFYKQNKELGEEIVNAEKRRLENLIKRKNARGKSRKVPINLMRDNQVNKPEIKAKIANSQRLIKGLVGPACDELLEDLFDVDALAEQLISYSFLKQVEMKSFSEARRLRLRQQQRQRNARIDLLSPPGLCFKFDGLNGDLPTSGPLRFNSAIFGSNTALQFLTDKETVSICGSDPIIKLLDSTFTLLRPNTNPFLKVSEPETGDDAIDSNLQELSNRMVEYILDF